MTAAVGGLDVLVMTSGIAEHAGTVRAGVATRLAYLGVAVDPDANEGAHGDADISAHGARARTIVVTAREDLEISRQVRDLVATAS